MTNSLLWLLIDLQIMMGAFDMLYHHEFTERLPWRANAATELKLHAVRNGFYGALFLLLGCTRPTGALAILVMLVLAIELTITLWDFVEEDMTRKLPATERVAHTLLALNYGAIIALLAPELVSATGEPSGLALVNYGLQTWLLGLAAPIVALFGVRDWFMSNRMRHLARHPAAPLADGLMPNTAAGRRRILITGATGFIGRRLVEALTAGGNDVIALVRNREAAAHLATPLTLVTSLDQIQSTERIDAIVNLAGAPIAEWPWTRTNRLRILRSRLVTTKRVVALCARLDHKPAVLVSGSAIGWYGVRDGEALTEADGPGTGFAARVCATWEAAARHAEPLGIRVVRLRTGLVLGRDGGLLARLLPPFDFGLGGPVGAGTQIMSWIARDDLVRLIVFALGHDTLSGAVNATAPSPVSSAGFASAVGAALHRPAVLPLPALPIRLVLGEMGEELLLGGQRVLPATALAAGFRFAYPTIAEALAAEIGAARPRASPEPARVPPPPYRTS